MRRRNFMAAASLAIVPGAVHAQPKAGIRIKLTSVWVDDQDKALEFYTEKLGFVKKHDIPLGKAKWLTVVSSLDPDGTELLLEPEGLPEAKALKKALFAKGIPFTLLHVENIEKEYERLTAAGVTFKTKPTKMGPTTIAVFDDTCGNYIQLVQPS